MTDIPEGRTEKTGYQGPDAAEQAPGMRIMIVEDEVVTALGIQDSLEAMGHEVSSAVLTGEAAIQKASEDAPDLILMDITLGGEIDGIEAAARIRSFQDIPVIYLTALTDDYIFQRAKITGPFGYIVKPFSDYELHIAIEMAQYKHRTETELKRYRNELMELVEERTTELDNRNREMALEILERKQTEELLQTTTELLKLFPNTYYRKEYLESVVEIIQSWTGCHSVGIRVLNGKENALSESYTAFTGEFRESENCLSREQDQCLYHRVITGKMETLNLPALTPAGSFYCNNTGALSAGEKARYGGICVHEGYMSIAIIPLRFMDRTVAAIHIADKREGMVPLKIVRSIESMAPLIGEALHRFQMEEELLHNYESLQKSNELLEGIFSNIHVLIAYMDRDFNFIRVNNKYAASDNREQDFYKGKNHFDLFPSDENKALFQKVVDTGKSCFVRAKPFKYTHNPERGTTFWDWSLKPVMDAEGKVSGLVLSLIDVTDNIMLYGELMRTDHLASIGRLAAGVAHEVNNPINGVINYAQILANSTDQGSREHDIAIRIIKESDRIAGIVSSLLSFARENKGEKLPVSVREILSDTLALLGMQLKKDNIKLNVDIPDDLSITANSQQIEQVFLNIISNSRQALNEKYCGESSGKVLGISGKIIKINETPFARIVFHDTGTGIPDDIMNNLMTPFFSTKQNGTGLGLSISHGIVSDHGGSLLINSKEGEFTKVIIDLPAAHSATD